jgi:hypothetical protein
LKNSSDWSEELSAVAERLASWNEGFHREYRKLRKQRSGWFGSWSEADEEHAAAEARTLAGEEFLVELFRFLDELCGAYLEEPLPAVRAKMRARVGEHPGLQGAVWSYAVQGIELTRREGAPRLRLALAAVSLDDVRTDIEEVRRVVGELCVAASQAGADPRPELAAVAAVSNPGTGGGGAFTQHELGEFARSAYFKDHVEPRLETALRA